MTTTEELLLAKSAAASAYNEVKEQRATFVRLRVDEARKLAEAQAEIDFSATLKALSDQVSATYQEYTQRREEEAVAGVGGKYPEGTILHEWLARQVWNGEPMRRIKSWEMFKTGRTARYTGVTRDTQLPDNLADYSLPKVGDFILQLIKKDGTVGKQIIPRGDLNTFHPEDWTPEPAK